jgi:hypothetical protein
MCQPEMIARESTRTAISDRGGAKTRIPQVSPMPCASPALLPIRSNKPFFWHMRCAGWQNGGESDSRDFGLLRPQLAKTHHISNPPRNKTSGDVQKGISHDHASRGAMDLLQCGVQMRVCSDAFSRYWRRHKPSVLLRISYEEALHGTGDQSNPVRRSQEFARKVFLGGLLSLFEEQILFGRSRPA